MIKDDNGRINYNGTELFNSLLNRFNPDFIYTSNHLDYDTIILKGSLYKALISQPAGHYIVDEKTRVSSGSDDSIDEDEEGVYLVLNDKTVVKVGSIMTS